MSIQRAKSAGRLYDECREFDLVLVPDAPLASALNRRLDRPQFGPFAITPRRLAARRREGAEDRLAFLDLVSATDLDWKEAAYVVGNVLQCWEHRGSAEAILEYDAFATPGTRTVVDRMTERDTTSGRLAEFTVDADTDVAVVGYDRLTTLERSILPDEYEVVDEFADGEFDHPPFRVLDSPAAIVDTVLDTVDEENAGDVAVVLDRSSAFSPLVESALEAVDLPYVGGAGFNDDPDHRAFVQLLRYAHDGRDTRVGDVRPLLTRLGTSVAVEHEEKRLRDLTEPGVSWLVGFASEIGEHTFASALDAYETETGATLDAFREELDELGMLGETTTEANVDRVAFYLQAYEVPVDRENEGVLLADAKSAAHVERPVVFYLGIDEGWTHSSPRRPWVNRDGEYRRNLQQFQLLLQNGVEQHYLVQDTAGGTPVTPCLYFEDLFDGRIERFGDLDSVRHGRTTRETDDGFGREPLDADVDPTVVERISQSSLNSYVNSPRDYLFGRLLSNPDRDYFREGNLFHDFAEFYVAHPEFVGDGEVAAAAEEILAEVDPFLRGVDREVRLTKYRLGLRTIVEYLDANPPGGDGLATPSRSEENHFAAHWDRPVETGHTERWFDNDALGLKGKIDLVHGPGHLLDYKSGSRKSAGQVVRHSATDPPSDTPNYQALLYLAHQRSERPDEPLQFTFFHFLETVDDLVVGEADLADCLTTVTYRPERFEAYVVSEAAFTGLQADATNPCNKTFGKVEYETYREVVAAHDLPDTDDADELRDSAFGRALYDRMVAEVGDYKYVQKGCRGACKHLLQVRGRTYFEDDVDAFESFVEERLAELNARRAGEERFPVEGPGGDPNERYLDHRDCLLEGAR